MSDAPHATSSDTDREQPLLSVRGLSRRFALAGPGGRSFVQAVDDVSFDLHAGRTLGVVGESGSGKSTLARLVLRLIEPDAGQVTFEGVNLLALSRRAMRPLRRRMQIVFQDPYGSFNPRMRIGEIIGEPLRVHRMARGRQLRRRVDELLEQCGMWSEAAERYPHEFSGGQRQRIGIARALACEPELIICDEPTSALDVSVQAQILNLLGDLQRDHSLGYLFISHDMAVIDHMADDIAVMRNGKIVELGDRAQIIGDPQHAYTQSLLASVPHPEPPGGAARQGQVSAGEAQAIFGQV